MRENRDSTLKAATVLYQPAMRDFRCDANAMRSADDERDGEEDESEVRV